MKPQTLICALIWIDATEARPDSSLTSYFRSGSDFFEPAPQWTTEPLKLSIICDIIIPDYLIIKAPLH